MQPYFLGSRVQKHTNLKCIFEVPNVLVTMVQSKADYDKCKLRKSGFNLLSQVV